MHARPTVHPHAGDTPTPARRADARRRQPWPIVLAAGVLPIVVTAVITVLLTRHSTDGLLTAAHHGSAAIRWTIVVSACAAVVGAIVFRPIARILGIARDAG